MKLFLEVQSVDLPEPFIDKVKEVPDVATALKDKDKVKKSFIHKCFHDESHPKPCKRVEITTKTDASEVFF